MAGYNNVGSWNGYTQNELPKFKEELVDRPPVVSAQDRETWQGRALMAVEGWGNSPNAAASAAQLDLLDAEKNEKARRALSAVDKIRDKFGEKSVKLAAGMAGDHAERVQENPVGLPGKQPKKSV